MNQLRSESLNGLTLVVNIHLLVGSLTEILLNLAEVWQQHKLSFVQKQFFCDVSAQLIHIHLTDSEHLHHTH